MLLYKKLLLVTFGTSLVYVVFKVIWIADCIIEACFCRQDVLQVFSQYGHSVSNHERSNLTLSEFNEIFYVQTFMELLQQQVKDMWM